MEDKTLLDTTVQECRIAASNRMSMPVDIQTNTQTDINKHINNNNNNNYNYKCNCAIDVKRFMVSSEIKRTVRL